MSESGLGHVLVMGSNGLLGSAIMDLLKQGHGHPGSVHGFDINPAASSSTSFFLGDIRDHEQVRKAVAEKDAVFNTVSVVNFNPKNDAWMESINVGGAENVLKACEDAGVSKLIHTSSMDVVYDGRPIAHGNEDLPYAENFLDHYSYTKRIAEELILTTERNVARCALRATGIYGPNDHIRFPAILEAVLSGKYATIGGREVKYSHVYSYNCAYAHILAAKALEKGNKVDGSAYFIVDDSTMNFHDFVDRVLMAAGLEKPTRTLPVGMAKIIASISERWIRMPWVSKNASPLITKLGISTISKDLWFTGEKAREELGYEPIVSLDEAIATTADWIRQHYIDQNK